MAQKIFTYKPQHKKDSKILFLILIFGSQNIFRLRFACHPISDPNNKFWGKLQFTDKCFFFLQKKKW